MTLIASPRHSDEDLRVWADLERYDLMWRGPRADKMLASAIGAITAFAPDYAGVSWGKDSVVTAALVRRAAPSVPLVWVRVRDRDNPDCVLVRDAFLSAFPGPYAEIEISPSGNDDPIVEAHRQGFRAASSRFGERHVSGVRADESSQRAMSAAVHGVATDRSCRPILRWSGRDVFGFLATHALPVHPAYACSFDGALDRERLRVAAVGGCRGTGRGRGEWERHYYREVTRDRVPLERRE